MYRKLSCFSTYVTLKDTFVTSLTKRYFCDIFVFHPMLILLVRFYPFWLWYQLNSMYLREPQKRPFHLKPRNVLLRVIVRSLLSKRSVLIHTWHNHWLLPFSVYCIIFLTHTLYFYVISTSESYSSLFPRQVFINSTLIFSSLLMKIHERPPFLLVTSRTSILLLSYLLYTLKFFKKYRYWETCTSIFL